MNAEPVRPGPGGEEDSWETLAEDLFGINLGADPAGSALVTPDDLSLDEPEGSPASAKAGGSVESAPISAALPEEKKKPAPVAKPPVGRKGRAQSTSAPLDDSDFGADLDLDDQELDQEAAEAEESPFGEGEDVIAVGNDEGDRDSDSPMESASDEDDRNTEGEDTYWDTLKDWQWSEEDDDSREHRERSDRGGSRRGGGGRPRAGSDQRSGRGDRPRQRTGDRSGGRSGGRRPGPSGEQSRQSERPPARRHDERSESRPPDRPSGRPAERPRRPEPPRASDVPPEVTDDFGAGLLDEDFGRSDVRMRNERSSDNVQRAEDEDAGHGDTGAVENASEGEGQFDSERPPRRRRRRRRSRSRRETSAGPAERNADVVDDEAIEAEETEPSLSDEPVDESRGGPDDETEREESGRPRRRRRRRRRGRSGEPGAPPSRQERSPDTVPARSESREPAKSSFEPPHDADEDDDDIENEGEVEEGEIDDEAPRVYRNVPTWEEAISYLLHRRTGESRSHESDSGRPRDSRRD